MDIILYKNALFVSLTQAGFIQSNGDNKWKFTPTRTIALKGAQNFDSSQTYSHDDIVDVFARGVQNVDTSQIRAVA